MKILLGITLAGLLLTAFFYKVSRIDNFQFFGTLIDKVDTQEKLVALTFDDGPTEGKTEEILKFNGFDSLND